MRGGIQRGMDLFCHRNEILDRAQRKRNPKPQDVATATLRIPDGPQKYPGRRPAAPRNTFLPLLSFDPGGIRKVLPRRACPDGSQHTRLGRRCQSSIRFEVDRVSKAHEIRVPGFVTSNAGFCQLMLRAAYFFSSLSSTSKNSSTKFGSKCLPASSLR